MSESNNIVDLAQLAATGEIYFDKIEYFYDEDGNLCADVWYTPPKPIEYINLNFIASRSNVTFEEICGSNTA